MNATLLLAAENAATQLRQHEAVCPVEGQCVKCDQLRDDFLITMRILDNSRFHWLARDDFHDGGVLVDADRPWAMRDKVQHFVGGMILSRLVVIVCAIVVRLLDHRPRPVRCRGLALLLTLMAALLVEGIEVVRLYRWWMRTEPFRKSGWEWHWDTWRWSNATSDSSLTMALPATPPEMADGFSWRDVLITVIGGAFAL